MSIFERTERARDAIRTYHADSMRTDLEQNALVDHYGWSHLDTPETNKLEGRKRRIVNKMHKAMEEVDLSPGEIEALQEEGLQRQQLIDRNMNTWGPTPRERLANFDMQWNARKRFELTPRVRQQHAMERAQMRRETFVMAPEDHADRYTRWHRVEPLPPLPPDTSIPSIYDADY